MRASRASQVEVSEALLRESEAWDACETAERIRRGEVRAEEMIEAGRRRAEAARALGAVVGELARPTPRPEARALPFAGQPTFVKDLQQVRGMPTGFGSGALRPRPARRSDPIVRRMEAAGLTFLGKSAAPEMGLTGTTEPLAGPPCRNPWDLGRSAGGSSGGAAALVAAGVIPLAHGNDGGGSIRIPAACCGLVGLKVSRGRMDMAGSKLLPVNVAVEGCLSRSVRDTVAFWRAVEPSASVLGPLLGPEPIGEPRPEPAGPLRIGFFADSPLGAAVHPDTAAAARGAARLLEALGHHVEEIPCPFPGSVIEDFLRAWGFVSWIQMKTGPILLDRSFDPRRVEPWTAGLARSFRADLGASLAAMRRLRAFGPRYAEVLSRYPILLSPTTAEPAPELGYLATDHPYELVFRRLVEYLPFTPFQNIAGAPAISLPLGRSGGLPVGVQLAAGRGRERLLLELALQIERAQPWEGLAPKQAAP